MNSLGFCAYITKFVLICYVAKMRYCILIKDQKLGQILRVDKTCFLRLSHIIVVIMGLIHKHTMPVLPVYQ